MNDIKMMRTHLANTHAAAAYAHLSLTGSACAIAAIPDTEPQLYAAAGTPEDIVKLLPATIDPARRQRHGDRPTEPLSFEDEAAPAAPAVTVSPAPRVDELEILRAAALSLLDAATVYAFAYMQDEAEDEDDCVCGPEQHERAKAVFAAIKHLDLTLAIPLPPIARQAQPTDLSKRLRESACFSTPAFNKMLTDAADEIERYYGAMLAWKRTAEKKDRDWNEARMARENDRVAARAQPTDRDAVLNEVAAWYADKGWLLDEDDVPAAIRALKGKQ